jgi:hypothetical protein
MESEIEFDMTNPPSPPSLKRNSSLAPSAFGGGSSSGMLAPAPELLGFVSSAVASTDQSPVEQEPKSGGGIFSFLF